MFGRKRAVLLLKDAEGTVENVRKFLKEIEPEALVVEAANAKDAQNRSYLQKFDLVILDQEKSPDAEVYLEALSGMSKDMAPKSILLLVADASAAPKGLPVQTTLLPRNVGKEKIASLLNTETRPAVVKVDINFILPFIDGAMHVFETMAGMKSEREDLFVRSGTQISGDISALISMESSKFQGSMAIAFEAATFLGLVNAMLGEKHTEVTAEISDAAGEVCNQIFGYAKVKLNAQGHDIRPAIPSVVIGPGHSIKHMVNGPCLAVRFRTQYGKFVVEAVVQAPGAA